MRDLEAFLDSVNARVTGEVRVQLFKGAIRVDGTRSPYSLLDPDVAIYGEGADGLERRGGGGLRPHLRSGLGAGPTRAGAARRAGRTTEGDRA